MAKNKVVYICSNCGFESPKSWGKCPECDSWNTFELFTKEAIQKTNTASGIIKAEKISSLSATKEERFPSGIKEFDNVIGGGIVLSALTLIGGEPGIGKSTLLLQIASSLDSLGKKILYASGEESLSQIKMRIERLNLPKGNIFVLSSTDMNQILDNAKEIKPDLLIVDSIQTVYFPELNSVPGNSTQVKECTQALMNYAKSTDTSIFIVGHITKQGTLAGPKTIEHMVDTVLYFESEDNGQLRVIRSAKNRFGSTNEVGIFEMTQKGLSCVENPSKKLLEGKSIDASGSCICPIIEGNRAILIELQALCVQTSFPNPKRMASGFEYNRFCLLMAVMEKMTGIKLNQYDIYINIVGGIKISDTDADLAVISSVYSSVRNKPIPQTTAVFGEVGLCAEVRSVNNPTKRIKEAINLGFNKIIIPKCELNEKEFSNKIEIIKITNLYELFNKIFN